MMLKNYRKEAGNGGDPQRKTGLFKHFNVFKWIFIEKSWLIKEARTNKNKNHQSVNFNEVIISSVSIQASKDFSFLISKFHIYEFNLFIFKSSV